MKSTSDITTILFDIFIHILWTFNIFATKGIDTGSFRWFFCQCNWASTHL